MPHRVPSATRRKRFRHLILETLETRKLLAADFLGFLSRVAPDFDLPAVEPLFSQDRIVGLISASQKDIRGSFESWRDRVYTISENEKFEVEFETLKSERKRDLERDKDESDTTNSRKPSKETEKPAKKQPANENKVIRARDKSNASDPARGKSGDHFQLPVTSRKQLSGSVFVDANQDGVRQSSEQPIEGVEITLQRTQRGGRVTTFTTETNANGEYLFKNLKPGEYVVMQAQPSGFVDGPDYAGNLGGTVEDDRLSFVVTKTTHTHIEGYNFTEFTTGSVSGSAFIDWNQNASIDGVDYGIADLTVHLTGTTDEGVEVQLSMPTDSEGYFRFQSLTPGNYQLALATPDGHFSGNIGVGSAGGEAQYFDPTQQTISNIVLEAGVHAGGYHFGNYLPAAIQGTVFDDHNRSESLTGTDARIVNATVTLSGTDDRGAEVLLVTTTNLYGDYVFEDLRPGEYDVLVTSFSGYDFFTSVSGNYYAGETNDSSYGVAASYGFEAIALPAGGLGQEFLIGLIDPRDDLSIFEDRYETEIVLVGTTQADQFEIEVLPTGTTISVNESIFEFSNQTSHSIRVYGLQESDTFRFFGSEQDEIVEFRRGSARFTGDELEILAYSSEHVEFVGGGGGDEARFFDTSHNVSQAFPLLSDDQFTARPFSAEMWGDNFSNTATDVPRIYAYSEHGVDIATISGQSEVRNNLHLDPEQARLFNDSYYLYVGGFESTLAESTHSADRLYVTDSVADDQFRVGDGRFEILNDHEGHIALGFNRVWLSADGGGSDQLELHGTEQEDWIESKLDGLTFQAGALNLDANGIEMTVVYGGGGLDHAALYDTPESDELVAYPRHAELSGGTRNIAVHEFADIYVYSELGGDDRSILHADANAEEVFRISPLETRVSASDRMLATFGFEKVEAFGQVEDLAYLYDTAGDDLLQIDAVSAQLSSATGSSYSLLVHHFGKVNAEANLGGNDTVVFADHDGRSTFRMRNAKATFFGRGFSQNAIGFDRVEAIYDSLQGRDNIDFAGNIQYDTDYTQDAEGHEQRKISASIDAIAEWVTLKGDIRTILS